MGFMTIDRIRVEFTDEPNVLSVIRKADIDIPTLCYHSELSIYGACRLCTVENERGKPKERKVTLKADKISEYFAEDCSSEEIEGIIIQLLDEWKKRQ